MLGGSVDQSAYKRTKARGLEETMTRLCRPYLTATMRRPRMTGQVIPTSESILDTPCSILY